MTVANNYAPVVAAANGSTTAFSGSWNAISAAALVVQLLNTTTGIYTTITQGVGSTQYQITSLTSSGFGISFNTAPVSGNNVVISRNTAPTQTVPYTTSRGFQGVVEEGSFDALTNMVQELTDLVGNSIQVPVGDTPTTLFLPIASLRAQKALIFDASGNVTVSVDNYDDQVAAVAASAAAAASSASSATSSASAASGSASTASSQATAAAGSATSAAGSATTATTEAGIATTQAGNASTSATAAAASATSASTSAGTATTQAGIATTQAGNASTSATAASGSATTASTQAGIATTQAGNAATSATAAAASATSAANFAAGLIDTSTTSNTIGTGSKSFTCSTGKQFAAGQFISIANTPTPTNYMHGQVTSYNSGTGALVVNVTDTGGSGTFTAWSISVSGSQGATGPSGSGYSEHTISGATNAVSSQYYVATTALTLTMPISTGQTTAFSDIIFAEGGNVTIALASGTDHINGGSAGASITVLQGQIVIATTDAAGNYYVGTVAAITNAMLAPMAANTVKVNATSGSATPTDLALAASNLLGMGSTGNIAPITIGTGLGITGTVLSNTKTDVVSVKQQIFTAGGTYTPSTGMIYCKVRMIGGGAGGGSSSNIGGGSGEYAEGLFTAATIGSSQTVTIGAGGVGGTTVAAGGTTSLGAILTAVGGAIATGFGGTGGTGTGLHIQGGDGDANAGRGNGGSGYFGGAGLCGGTTGQPGKVNSGGGGGGGSGTAGNGGTGVMIIEEYCTQ